MSDFSMPFFGIRGGVSRLLFSQKTYDNVVIVKSPDDFSPIVSGEVSPSPNKVYILDGAVDMEDIHLVIPQDRLCLAGLNGARDLMQIYSSVDNHVIFISDTYSGDLIFENFTMNATGLGSKIFDIDNDNNSSALDWTNVNILDATEIGNIANYRQFFMNGGGFIGTKKGITFDGTWTGITLINSIAIGNAFASGEVFLKAGIGFTLGNLRSNLNFRPSDPTAIFCDFSPSNILNDASFSLREFRTTVTNALPNIAGSSVRAKYSDCLGIRNTYTGGTWNCSSASTTTITTAGTFVKLAGTTTYDDLQHFSQTTDNAFVYDSSQEIEIRVDAIIGLSGATNREARLRIVLWDDSASSYVVVSESSDQALNGGVLTTRAENVSISGITAISENDRIEIWGTNMTDTNAISMLENSRVIIEERGS